MSDPCKQCVHEITLGDCPCQRGERERIIAIIDGEIDAVAKQITCSDAEEAHRASRQAALEDLLDELRGGEDD
jgi:hypothetical protein